MTVETLALNAEVIARGDGTYLLRPRAPVMWVRTTEAARQCSVSERTIQRWIKEQRIIARRLGPRIWQVDLASLKATAA